MTTLGTVDLRLESFDGWGYPKFGSTVLILSDGSSIDNEVLQSGAIPRLRASLTGHGFSSSDVATLRGYDASKEAVTFSDDDGDRTVHVLGFSVRRDRAHPWLWEWSLELMAGDETSS